MSFSRKNILFLLSFGTCLLAGAMFQESSKVFDKKLHLFVYEVSVGDGFLIQTPHGKIISIDGGVDGTFSQKVGKTLPFWKQDIDLMIVTHPDLDHLFGNAKLLERSEVKAVLLSAVSSDSALFQEFLGTIANRQIPLTIGNAATDFTVDGVEFDILSPSPKQANSKPLTKNNASLVIRMCFQLDCVLLTGDAEKEAELALLKEPVALRSAILKVGHHGSKTSSTPLFLDGVHPAFALISAGPKNPFGHPHHQVLAELKKRTITPFVTKEMGDLEVVFDNKRFDIKKER